VCYCIASTPLLSSPVLSCPSCFSALISSPLSLLSPLLSSLFSPLHSYHLFLLLNLLSSPLLLSSLLILLHSPLLFSLHRTLHLPHSFKILFPIVISRTVKPARYGKLKRFNNFTPHPLSLFYFLSLPCLKCSF
jgi:hypothetical protein